MAEIVVSAPGKVILHGEHSVVYGKVAVASSLNLRCFLRATVSADGKVTLDLPNINIRQQWDVKSFQQDILPVLEMNDDENGVPVPPSENCLQVMRTFACLNSETSETRDLAIISFLYLFCRICGKCNELGELPALHLRLLSELPVGAGLGSSAAYSVCLASVLLWQAGMIKSPAQPSALLHEENVTKNQDGGVGWGDSDRQLINQWAFLAEKIIHGQPSGIDNSVSAFGGAIRFKNRQITPVEKMPNIKILLTNTKVQRSTKTLVTGVRTRHDKFPEVMSPLLQAMDGLAERSIHVYEALHDHSNASDCYAKLVDLVDINQSLLNAIGVGHSSLDEVVRTTLRYNLHTKLTGAGGGGCAYTLLTPEAEAKTVEAVCRDLRDLGYECWETSIGAAGVCFHSEPHKDRTVPTQLFL